jgi:hypothetical protein
MNGKDYDTGYRWKILLKNGKTINQCPSMKVSDFDYREVDKFLLEGDVSLSIDVDDELIYFHRVIRSFTFELLNVIIFWGTRTMLYEIDPFSDTYQVHTKNIPGILKGSVGCFGETNIMSQDLTPE